jgi:hypothetical protein
MAFIKSVVSTGGYLSIIIKSLKYLHNLSLFGPVPKFLYMFISPRAICGNLICRRPSTKAVDVSENHVINFLKVAHEFAPSYLFSIVEL